MPIPSMGGSIPNLQDNIDKAFKKFKIKDFIGASEAGDSKKGKKSVVMKVKKGLGCLLKLIGLILTIIAFILAILGLFSDAMDDILEYITELIGGIMGGFGLTISVRSGIINSLIDQCINIGPEEGSEWNFNLLDIIVSAGLIIALACTETDGTFKNMYTVYLEGEVYAGIRNDMRILETKVRNFPMDYETQKSYDRYMAARLSLLEGVARENHSDIIHLESEIDSLKVTQATLKREYNEVLKGKYVKDITALEKHIDQVAVDLKGKQVTLENKISNLTSNEIVDLRNNLTRLKREFDAIKEEKKDPRQVDIEQQLAIKQREYVRMLEDTNAMFTQIAAMVVNGLPKNKKVKIEGIVTTLEDIVSVTPGRHVSTVMKDAGRIYVEKMNEVIPVNDLIREREARKQLNTVEDHTTFNLKDFKATYDPVTHGIQLVDNIGVVKNNGFDPKDIPSVDRLIPHKVFERLIKVLDIIDPRLYTDCSDINLTKVREPGYQICLSQYLRTEPMEENLVTDRTAIALKPMQLALL